MMASQLGRMILDASEASADEMTAKPDSTGRYGQMDGFLADLAGQIRIQSDAHDEQSAV